MTTLQLILAIKRCRAEIERRKLLEYRACKLWEKQKSELMRSKSKLWRLEYYLDNRRAVRGGAK